jgi:hypothetical protein
MQSTSKGSFQPNIPMLTRRSSCMTNQSAIKSGEDRTSFSPTTNASADSARQYCMPTGLSTRGVEEVSQKEKRRRVEDDRRKRMLVEDSTVKTGVASLKTNATTSMFVRNAEREDTERRLVPQKSSSMMTDGLRPRYLRHNIWGPDSDFSPNTADWTLTAAPLEGPPQSVLDDEAVTKTINKNPDLFRIITPINVDVFEAYLVTHPNQPFVKSVCKGLREGFWPWAEAPGPGYPVINDESKPAPVDEKKADFLRRQRDVELTKDRFSAPLTHGLLPGMYCMPIYAVPKPHSTDL